MVDINKYIDINKFSNKQLFQGKKEPWHILESLNQHILKLIRENNEKKDFTNLGFISDENVLIGEGSVIEPTAFIKGPAIIGKNVIIRHGAYIRENVVIGDNCIIGHASELKHTIILDNSKLPHFNYVGNSIIGNNVNLGAGVICSNVKNIPFGEPIYVRYEGNKYSTNTKYFGALIGDNSKIGCNTVLNPGTIVGKNVTTYPLTQLRGYIESNSIIKNKADS